jgi:ribonuclease D
VLKVFHSCSEDLEVLYHLAGEFTRPVFDTQIAAAFAGHGHSLGYARLVHLLHAVELPKGETRTDWLRRPLSQAQLRYAAQDVTYLLPMYEELLANLRTLGRESWIEEEIARLFDPQRFLPEPADAFRRVKQHRTLPRRALGLLKILAQWREQEARRRDLPRGFILKDKVLIQLAHRPPLNERQLATTPLLPPSIAKRFGRKILGLVKEGMALDESELPTGPSRVFDSSAHKKSIQALRKHVGARAEELRLPPELLATRRQVERLFARVAEGKERPLQEEMRGWRRQAIGEDLQKMSEDALR